MLNTDELDKLARGHGVNSVPTVKVFRHGQVIDTLHGAESESSLRAFINKHVGGADTLYLSALQAHQSGNTAQAITFAAEAAMEQPDDPRIPLDLAKLLVLQGRYTQARDLLQALPPELKSVTEISALLHHLGFILTAQDAPTHAQLEQTLAAHPGDLEARYQLATVKLTQDDYEGAMEQLLDILRRDRGFRQDAGHTGLLVILRMLPEDDERVQRYRVWLRAALH